MARISKDILKAVLTIALVMGMISSSNSRMVSHDIIELAKIVAEHRAEISDHGHAHEDIVDVMHAYHRHAHDVADHDHNIAYLSPRRSSNIALPTRMNWALTSDAMSDRRDFDLDRPPRV